MKAHCYYLNQKNGLENRNFNKLKNILVLIAKRIS